MNPRLQEWLIRLRIVVGLMIFAVLLVSISIGYKWYELTKERRSVILSAFGTMPVNLIEPKVVGRPFLEDASSCSFSDRVFTDEHDWNNFWLARTRKRIHGLPRIDFNSSSAVLIPVDFDKVDFLGAAPHAEKFRVAYRYLAGPPGSLVPAVSLCDAVVATIPRGDKEIEIFRAKASEDWYWDPYGMGRSLWRVARIFHVKSAYPSSY